jgi:NAD(P)H-hydrate epimerase
MKLLKLLPSVYYLSSLIIRRTFSFGLSISKNNLSIMNSLYQNNNNEITYITSSIAQNIDIDLMKEPAGFSLDQLMELAGYSVACSAHQFYITIASNDYKTMNDVINVNMDEFKSISKPKVVILCGPGNNGGDGMVAGRHLTHFGYDVSIVLPKHKNSKMFTNLIEQCNNLKIEILKEIDINRYNNFDLCIDSLFGFSFKGPPRDEYMPYISLLTSKSIPVLSVDIPSFWDVNNGDIYSTGFLPEAVISLTLPKICMKGYNGIHYIGGRFIPNYISTKYDLILPNYGFGVNQIALL